MEIINSIDYVIYNKDINRYARMLDTSNFVAWREYTAQSGGWCSGNNYCTHFSTLEQANYYCNEINRKLKISAKVIKVKIISQLEEV